MPEALNRIKDVEAKEFVAKCLATASKRLPARELLLDPFLASDGEAETVPVPKVPSLSSGPHGTVEDIVPSLLADPTKTTEMTITGTMDPQDDTIFLKVQISDKDGIATHSCILYYYYYYCYKSPESVFMNGISKFLWFFCNSGRTRNIYFPFDIMHDTAIDVAMEMVKELEISDFKPMEIAEMIEERISSLIPSWKECGLSQVHRPQHSFSYEDDEDDDDDGMRHPFYANSSHSSSQASLLAFNYSFETNLRQGRSAHDWFQGRVDQFSLQFTISTKNALNMVLIQVAT